MFEYTLKETILKINDLNLTLGDNKILRDINLEIKDIIRPNMNQGQIIAILAPSGIGKSQLLKRIAGLSTFDSGNILIGLEQNPVELGDVGFVQQNYQLWEHRTVLSHLTRVARDKNKNKIEEYLVHFGLSERRNLYPNQLSGGQKQRVAIAQALLHSVNFLLLDEPTSGLDYPNTQKLKKTLIDLNTLDELNTLIITTHNIEFAVEIADTIIILGREVNKEGATILKKYNLYEMGLAWQENITPAHTELVNSIKQDLLNA